MGQPKGEGPTAGGERKHNPKQGSSEPDRRGRVGFYRPPVRFQVSRERKGYKQSEKVTDNRPPGRELDAWSQKGEYGTGRLSVPEASE